VVDVAAGKSLLESPFVTESLALRLRNGPFWSPDGARWPTLKRYLWTIAVDASGKFTGAPHQHTQELSDRSVVDRRQQSDRLSRTDHLKKVELATDVAVDIPLDLTWSNAPGPAPRSCARESFSTASTRMSGPTSDVIIRGNKIAAIQPAGAKLPDGAEADRCVATDRDAGAVRMHTSVVALRRAHWRSGSRTGSPACAKRAAIRRVR